MLRSRWISSTVALLCLGIVSVAYFNCSRFDPITNSYLSLDCKPTPMKTSSQDWVASGRPVTFVLDRIDGTSTTEYFLEFDNEEKVKLNFPSKELAEEFDKNQYVRIMGEPESDSSFSVSNLESFNVSTNSVGAGPRNLIAIIADFQNGGPGFDCTKSQVQNAIFGSTGSLDGYYRETSGDAVSFTGLVLDPISISSDGSDCEMQAGTWKQYLKTVAENGGLDLSSDGPYDHVMFVLPLTGGCNGVGGRGQINGRETTIYSSCTDYQIMAHEIGHNFGLKHSEKDGSTYGDSSCVMGSGSSQLNAPWQTTIGWMPIQNQRLITGNREIDIAPLDANPYQTSLPQVVMIDKESDPGYRYYLSFRRDIGEYTSSSSTYLEKLNIHEYSGIYNTDFLAGKATGQTFRDDTNGITVTHVSHSGNVLRARIEFDDYVPDECNARTQAVTVSAATIDPLYPNTRIYSVNIQNRDTGDCTSSNFSLSVLGPSGFNISIDEQTFDVLPGNSDSTEVRVTPSSSASDGQYALEFRVRDNTDPAHETVAVPKTLIIGSGGGSIGCP